MQWNLCKSPKLLLLFTQAQLLSGTSWSLFHQLQRKSGSLTSLLNLQLLCQSTPRKSHVNAHAEGALSYATEIERDE